MYFAPLFAPFIPNATYALGGYSPSLYYMIPIPREQSGLVVNYMQLEPEQIKASSCDNSGTQVSEPTKI